MESIEVLFTLLNKTTYQWRFPVGTTINIDLQLGAYQYVVDPNRASATTTTVSFLAYMVASTADIDYAPYAKVAMPQPGQRVIYDMNNPTLQVNVEPIVTPFDLKPLFTGTGLAYFGTLHMVTASRTNGNSYENDMALRLPLNRRTAIDTNAVFDADGVYLSPFGDTESLTTMIAENAEIFFVRENSILPIANATDIVFFFVERKLYIVASIELTPLQTVPFIEPYMSVSFNGNDMSNAPLTIPLTGDEYLVNFVTNTVTQKTSRTYDLPPYNTSVAIVTFKDGQVQPMLAQNTSFYGFQAIDSKLKFLGGNGYVTPLFQSVTETPQTNVVDTPVIDILIDGTPADGTPTDDIPTDGTPADGTPTDNVPTDGTPIENAPVNPKRPIIDEENGDSNLAVIIVCALILSVIVIVAIVAIVSKIISRIRSDDVDEGRSISRKIMYGISA